MNVGQSQDVSFSLYLDSGTAFFPVESCWNGEWTFNNASGCNHGGWFARSLYTSASALCGNARVQEAIV